MQDIRGHRARPYSGPDAAHGPYEWPCTRNGRDLHPTHDRGIDPGEMCVSMDGCEHLGNCILKAVQLGGQLTEIPGNSTICLHAENLVVEENVHGGGYLMLSDSVKLRMYQIRVSSLGLICIKGHSTDRSPLRGSA